MLTNLLEHRPNFIINVGVIGLSRRIIKPSPEEEAAKNQVRKELLYSLEIYSTNQELGKEN